MYHGMEFVHAEKTRSMGAMPVTICRVIIKIPATAFSISSKQNIAMPISVMAKNIRMSPVKASLVGISRINMGSPRVTIQLIRLFLLALVMISPPVCRFLPGRLHTHLILPGGHTKGKYDFSMKLIEGFYHGIRSTNCTTQKGTAFPRFFSRSI